jgi:hypothetical protein
VSTHINISPFGTAEIAKVVAVFSIFVGRKLMKTNKHLQGMLDQGPQ